jgi:hypothetical protein
VNVTQQGVSARSAPPQRSAEAEDPPEDPQIPLRSRWWSRLAHLGVFALVAEVALVHLGTADAAPDEFVYRTCGQAYVHGSFTCNLEHPPLAKEILGVGSLVFGDSLSAARATTALVAIATAYCCYLFCRDVAGRAAGLVAATMWGLLPQVGIESGTTLEAVRIDRFALLDPYVACFVALALVAGARLTRRGGRGWAVLLGAAVAAAACAKAPGALIAPVACLVPLAVRKCRGQRIARDGAFVASGAIAIAIASYGPLGPSGAVRAIRYMFDFQTAHAAREVVVGGHFYVSAPWWADLAFATSALGVSVAIALLVLAGVGLTCDRGPSGYALAVAASVEVGVGFGAHLSAPHYFIDWEPGVVVAAALGLVGLARAALAGRNAFGTPPDPRRALSSGPRVRALVAAAATVAAAAVLSTGVVRTISAANTLQRGPYASAALAMQCERTCFVAYVGYLDVYASYVPRFEYLLAVPPSARNGHVTARVLSGGRRSFVEPDVVAIDPAAFVLHGSWRRSIEYFEAHWRALGYERVPARSRIEIFRLRSSPAFRRSP